MGTLRSLLAVSVLITHADPIFGINLLNGDFAVTCFYVISGFLITLILSEKYVTETKAFFVNRGLRVYVPYIAALLFSIVVFASIEFPSHNPISSYDRVRLTGDDSWIWWSAFSNVTLLGMDLTRYIQVNPTSASRGPTSCTRASVEARTCCSFRRRGHSRSSCSSTSWLPT